MNFPHDWGAIVKKPTALEIEQLDQIRFVVGKWQGVDVFRQLLRDVDQLRASSQSQRAPLEDNQIWHDSIR
ncbi:hypothetical protein [Paraburkholderia bannensis]|uniref:hypothetical protein n=1 Tax=Paraburkholderia bannensis TaxID=765414 RepID=UPI002AB7DBB2|nr:hypothetical protein [Paraburkholderia bannensis]